jgi:hypothetical protein
MRRRKRKNPNRIRKIIYTLDSSSSDQSSCTGNKEKNNVHKIKTRSILVKLTQICLTTWITVHNTHKWQVHQIWLINRIIHLFTRHTLSPPPPYPPPPPMSPGIYSVLKEICQKLSNVETKLTKLDKIECIDSVSSIFNVFSRKSIILSSFHLHPLHPPGSLLLPLHPPDFLDYF